MKKSRQEQTWHAMVVAVRAGESQRTIARRYRVSLSTVQFWVDVPPCPDRTTLAG